MQLKLIAYLISGSNFHNSFTSENTFTLYFLMVEEVEAQRELSNLPKVSS